MIYYISKLISKIINFFINKISLLISLFEHLKYNLENFYCIKIIEELVI